MNVHELTLQNYTAASGCPSACQPTLYLGTAGSYGNEQINVVLGEGWQGLTVKAVFQPCGVAVVVPNGGGVISVPWEATQSVIAYPKGRIVFEGVMDGRVLISTDIPYAVGSHSDTEGSNSQPPTPSEWEQYVDEVKGDADRAEQAAKDAEATLQDVKDAGAQAVTDIGNAKDSALEAIDAAREEAAGSIAADVEGAKQAAADAEKSAADAEQSAKDAATNLEKVQAAGKSALDDIATELQNTLSDIQNEGTKQQSAVAGSGTAALEAIGQTEQAAINQVKQAGATQVSTVQSAGATQTSQINSAGAAQVQAVKDEGAAQTKALNDAAEAHKNELESIASHPPQPNTETGKWQVWNAETGAYQDTDALYQGGYYTASIAEDGTLTWQGSQAGMPELPSANIKGPKGDKGDPGLGVPTPTTSDAGKVPVVNAGGTGYELGDPQVDAYSKSESDARYAPLSAVIRPTASGNPVSITDSVEWPLLGLKVYGKSTQDGTPSPENPVPIVSAGDEGSIDLTVSDGADQSQQLTVITPNGLPGIPVDSGGNYTDASGQRRWSDIIDYNNEKKYQYINEVVVDGTNVKFTSSGGGNEQYWNLPTNSAPNVIQIAKSYINKYFPSNVFTSNEKYGFIFTMPRNMAPYFETVEELNAFCVQKNTEGNPLTIMYVMDTPIETPLSEDEIAAYRALHTYDGATVVSTAEDVAGLDIRYVADAQKYIDDRLTAAESHIQEIAAAQLNAQTGG